MEPIPPNTAATNALIPGMAPVYGVRLGYAEQSSTPAIAASAEPMAKVRAIVPFTLIPISCAAPLSSDTARIACPGFVFCTKVTRAIMITIHTAMVTIVTPEILSSPSARVIPFHVITELNVCGFAPKIKSARF